MLIYLYGEEEFLAKEKKKEIIEEYKKKYPRALNIFSFQEEDFSREKFETVLKTPSLFAEKKLIILWGIPTSDIEKIKFEEWQEIIFAIKTKKKSAAILKKADFSQEFEVLDNLKLVSWIRREVKKEGAEFEPKALNKFIELYGNNLSQLKNEISKLALYNKNISLNNVNIFCKVKEKGDVFLAIDKLGERNKKAALDIFKKLLDQGENEIYLLSMITYQFRNLLKVKTSKNPSLLKMHPFVLRKTKAQAEKFSILELKKDYKLLARLDFDVKLGKKASSFALDYFILKV